MDKWIRDLINSVTAGLTALINAVAERIAWVYTAFVGFFIKVRSAHDTLVKGVMHGLTALLSVSRETYNTLRWLILIRIPTVVTNAVNSAVNWLVQFIANVRAYLEAVISNVIRWATEQIARIDSFIDRILRWVHDTINAIVTLLTRVASLVLALLTDPRHLAAWAIDAITREFLVWLDKNADRMFNLARERSVSYALRFAGRIEDMISRLL